MAAVDCEAIRARDLPFNSVNYVSPNERPAGAVVDLVIFWLNLVILIISFSFVTLTKFVLIPRSSPYRKYLDVRFYPFIIALHLGGLLSLICGSLFSVVPFNTFPCWVTLLTVTIPALLAIPPATRFFTFYRQYQITKAINGTSLMVQHRARRTSLASVSDMGDDQADSGVRLKYILIGLFFPNRLKVDPTTTIKSEGQVSHGDDDDQSNQDIVGIVRTLKALSSMKGQLIILLICMAPYIVAFFALVGSSEFARNGCNTCTLPDYRSAQLVLYIGAAVPCLLCVFSSCLVRGVPDTLYIVREIRIAFVYFGLPTVIFVILSGTTLKGQDFDFRFLYQMTILGFILIQSAVPAAGILYHEYRLRASGNTTSDNSDRVYTNDIAEFEASLSDPLMHEAFHDHMIAEHSIEALRFHDEIQKWSREFHDVNVKTAQLRAKKIVSLFVGEDAVFPVNLSSKIMQSLRTSVGISNTKGNKGNTSFKQSSRAMKRIVEAEKDVRDIDQHFFDEADHEIKELMRLDAFARFQKTRRYRELKAAQSNSKTSTVHRSRGNEAIVPQPSPEEA